VGDEALIPEASRRRTFAIISHPDAGKTTLTEKLLLLGGAIDEAGAVRGKRGTAHARSDWMEIERERGISVTSAALRFGHRGMVLNLLDTPGHRDFSEDTYRVLTAADTAVMVVDAAKGLEPQTLKLFRVCRQRGTPIITFINKLDRPARGMLELIDEIEAEIGVTPTPVTWPVLDEGRFVGIVDRRDGGFISAGGDDEISPGAREALQFELDLLAGVGADHDDAMFRAGITTPLFVGSALGDCGVEQLLSAVEDIGLPPGPWGGDGNVDEPPRDVDGPFMGLVFKVQANTDPRHRDRIAYVRVCAGRFERGAVADVVRTGKPIRMSHAHQPFGQERLVVDEAFPGDIIGLVNAGDLRPGDVLHHGDPVHLPAMPRFAPEHFTRARNRDTTRYKQFQRGMRALDEEGVVQVLRHPDLGDQSPMLAAVGPMQIEVARARLEGEFGAPIDVDPPLQFIPRETDADGARMLCARGVEVLERATGEHVALFRNQFQVERAADDLDGLVLVRLLAD
jgi:peptide chain release factor 3